MTNVDDRLGRIEEKLDKLIERVGGELNRHEVELAKLRLLTRYVAVTLGIALLGGGGAASVLKILGG